MLISWSRAPPGPLALEMISTALWPVLGGAVLAILLGRCGLPAPFGKIDVAQGLPWAG
jgi:hypothetical protein